MINTGERKKIRERYLVKRYRLTRSKNKNDWVKIKYKVNKNYLKNQLLNSLKKKLKIRKL